MLKQTRAVVLNGDGQSLGTTKAGRAGYLIRQGKARLVSPIPLVIQLTYTVENPVIQHHSLGVDDGAKTAAVSVIVHHKDSDVVILKAEVPLRSDTKQRMDHRRSRRRDRRSRLRHRQPRSRRGDKSGWIAPSIQVRKDNVLRVARDLCRLLPISRIVYEEGQFDTRRVWDETVIDYQTGPNSGLKNRKKAVLWRDKYTCQYCGVKCIEAGLVAEVDHVIPRSRGGTDAWQNLVCSCQRCNKAKGNQTAAEFGYPQVKGKWFKYPAHVQVGKRYLKTALSKLAPVEVTYGWQTSEKRKWLKLPKTHTNDALSMAVLSDSISDEGDDYLIIARRRRRDMHNLRYQEGFRGFRHFDLVCWERKDGRRFIGTVRSFVPARNEVKCRFDFDDNYSVTASRLRLVWRFGSLVYVPQYRKEQVVSQVAHTSGETV